MTFKDWLQTSRYKDKDPLSVKELDCSYSHLIDLNGIEQFKNLTLLICSYNDIETLKGIEELTNLQILFCDNNKLKTLKGIENLNNINTLYCFENGLNSLKEIKNLKQLIDLYCDYNSLEHKPYYTYTNSISEFVTVKEFQQYLKTFYRKEKIYKIFKV